MKHPYENTIRDEVEHWPGATVEFSLRAKHAQAVVAFGGKSRFVIIPATPGDGARGASKALPDIRRELRALGAVRAQPNRSPSTRSASPRVDRPMLANIERAPVKENPFAILAEMIGDQR